MELATSKALHIYGFVKSCYRGPGFLAVLLALNKQRRRRDFISVYTSTAAILSEEQCRFYFLTSLQKMSVLRLIPHSRKYGLKRYLIRPKVWLFGLPADFSD
jgi:hypothetical protein